MEKPDKVFFLRTTGTEVVLSADAAKLPHRIKILNWGDNPNCHGKRVNVGPLFAKCLGAATYPYRKVALDFEHNTFPGTAAYKESSEPRPVAGFGTVEVVEGKGVYLTMSAWTPEGERNAVNFADVSAGSVTDKDGNVVAVASVALCRAGAEARRSGRNMTRTVRTGECPRGSFFLQYAPSWKNRIKSFC